MRHIPEEELHAYLDQGLSRSQCVEIESHLATCPSCQAARDGIAALRDRTTSLLAKLAPPRGFPLAFEALRRRADLEASARRRRSRSVIWAASLAAAVGLGWAANYLVSDRSGTPVPMARDVVASAASSPTVLPATPTVLRTPSSQPSRPQPARRSSRRSVRESSSVARSPLVAPPSLEWSSSDIPRAELAHGVWRTLSWNGTQVEAGDKLPHIDGLPVVQVQLQASEQGKRPLMVVAQQLASGEVIRTIEGPTSDVSHLLARRAMSDPEPSPSDHTDRTMAMQRGDRLLVITGALPSDSLLAMIRRLNAEMRSK